MSRRPNKPLQPLLKSTYVTDAADLQPSQQKPAAKYVSSNKFPGSELNIDLSAPVKRKYDFTERNEDTRVVSIDTITVKSSVDPLQPYGYIPGYNNASVSSSTVVQRDYAKQATLIYNAALEASYAPAKQLFATGFMLWMSGTTLQVFSIFMLAMAFNQPLNKLLAVQTEFSRFEQDASIRVNLLVPKLIYCAGCLAGIAMALWKCNQFGLLPTSVTDYIDMSVKHNPVYVYGV